MIEQTPTSIEHEPFVSVWLMFYILLILFFNCCIVYSTVKKTNPETEKEFGERFFSEYVKNKSTIVWSFSTIVFFVIYRMWNL